MQDNEERRSSPSPEHRHRQSEQRRERHDRNERQDRQDRQDRHHDRRRPTPTHNHDDEDDYDRERRRRDRKESPRSSRRHDDDRPSEQQQQQQQSEPTITSGHQHTDEAEHVDIDQPSRSADPPHGESSAAAPEAPDEPLQERSIVEAIQERQQSKRDSREQHAQLMAKEEAKIEELKATILDLERQEQEIISAIRGGGTPSEIIDKHIKQLHRYNEVKDAGQIILGKVAELEGTTIKKQYEVFGLDSED